MKKGKENIESICSEFLKEEILWIITPPYEYDIKSSTFWLEEDQGTREFNKTYKSELLIQFRESGQKHIIGLTHKWHEDNGICYPLFSLTIQTNGQLEIMKLKRDYSPVNVIAEIDFCISKIELWNRKDNFVNVYIKDNIIRADTLIFYSNDERQIVIQAIESVSQENSIKLRIRNNFDKGIELEKKYEMEIISKIENPASNNAR